MTIIPLQVEEKLNVAGSLKLPVYIGAPTGYGKTTILKKYFAKESVWWLSCKSGTVDHMKPVAAIEQKVIVVDDVSFLSDDKGIAYIAELIRSKKFVVLSSRSAFPTKLKKLELIKTFVCIVETDLRFGKTELEQVFSEYGAEVSEAVQKDILQISKGYPLGVIYFASLLARDKSFGKNMVADYFDALFQYWEENAFARLNADFIDFLMKMYPYRDFTPDMARYMTGIANPQEIMAEIVDVGSFVTRTGQNTFSFREEVITFLDSRRNAYFTDAESKNNYGYPIVSLSTTSISGEDHIVFNASLPMRYDGYDNRSCMAILDYDGSSLREVYSDDLTYDNGAYRMRYASATDGDLYGDGEQTLIVGGYKNDGLGNDPSKYNTAQGGLNGGTNLVQIIKYNTEENKYERGDHKTASRHSNGLCKMEDRRLTNPIAIAAVNFINSANAPEFLFLGGKVFKWSDDDALAEKWAMPLGDNNDDDPFIVKAFAMRGIDGNYMQEQLFVLAGDTDAGRADHDYLHTHTIININNAGKVDGAAATSDDVQLTDNFNDSWTRVDEDDDGDFCTAAPLQCSGYGATVRCTDKSVGWSDITVEAILQSVPYWEELTYGDGTGQSSFTISSGKSTGKEHEIVHSNGGFFEVSAVLGFELFNIGGTAGIAGSVEGHKKHGDQDGKEYAISGSLTINSHAGSDTAVLSATAIGHYLYEVYFPEHIVTASEHAYMAENYEAYGYRSPNDVPAVGALSKAYTTPWLNHVNYGQTYSSIEVNKFNDKVRDYYDAGGSQEKLGKIDMSKYNSAVIGDAYSYPADKEHIHNYATQQEYIDLDGNKKETEMIFVSKYPVTVNSNADSDAEIEIEFEQTITSGSSTGYDIGGTAGLTGEIDFLVGQIDGSAGYSGEREENTVYSDSTITGKSFGVQVCNWEDYTQDGDNNEVPGNKYRYPFCRSELRQR